MVHRDPRGIPTREEERELIRRAQGGNTEARNELMLRHNGYIKSLVKSFSRNAPEAYEDNYQVAVIAMGDAIAEFDESLGNRLITSSRWVIWQAMQIHRAQSRIVWVPLYLCDRRQLRKLAKESNRAVRYRAIAAAREALLEPVPLARESRERNSSHSYGNDPADPRVIPPDASVAEAEEVDAMLGHVERLPARLREIICRRFGLGGREPESLADIGRDMNLSRERVRQLTEKAMEYVRVAMERGIFATPISMAGKELRRIAT